MKLRNKNTGEVADVEIYGNCMLITHQDGRIKQYYIDSMKDLLVWEDYEGSKDYWRIDCDGEIINDQYNEVDFDKDCKEGG